MNFSNIIVLFALVYLYMYFKQFKKILELIPENFSTSICGKESILGALDFQRFYIYTWFLYAYK